MEQKTHSPFLFSMKFFVYSILGLLRNWTITSALLGQAATQIRRPCKSQENSPVT